MKYKRILSVLLAALFLLSILPMAAATTPEVFFTMINSNAPETLQEGTMPFTRNGNVYVPLAILGRFGISSLRQGREIQLFRFDNTDDYIHFDLDSQTATTSGDRTISAMPVQRFGTLFFPVGTTASAEGAILSFFGIHFQVIYIDPAPIVRLYDPAMNSLSHNAVQRNADSLFGLTLHYNAFVDEQDAPISLPQTPNTPGGGGDVQTTPSVPDTPDPEQANTPISFSFVGLTEDSDALLDALYSARISAGFFLTAEDARTHPDLVRRLHGEGHQVGIYLAEEADQEYAEASAALFDAARLRTVIVTAESEDVTQAAEDLGLIIHAAPIHRQFTTAEGLTGNLLFDSSGTAAQLLSALPNLLRGNSHRVLRFTSAVF